MVWESGANNYTIPAPEGLSPTGTRLKISGYTLGSLQRYGEGLQQANRGKAGGCLWALQTRPPSSVLALPLIPQKP